MKRTKKRMYKSWKRIRKRERGGIFEQRIVLEDSFLSLSLSLYETNEKENVQDLEKNSKEREGEDFWVEKLYWENHLSLSLFLLMNETNEKENVQKLQENSRKRERENEIRRERERGDFWTEKRIGRARWRETFDLSGRVHDRIVGTRILLQQPLRC